MNIEKITESITGVKSVLVYFNGTFPKKAYPLKDTSLPRRIFGDANMFYIRCKHCEKNYEYFDKLYSGVNDLGEPVKYKIVTIVDDSDLKKLESVTDAMYMPWIGFDGYQQNLAPFKIEFHAAMIKYRKPVYLFINDPCNSSFKSIYEYIDCKNETEITTDLWDLYKWIHKNQPAVRDTLYRHVHFMPNDTPFNSEGGYWWQGKVKEIDQQEYRFTVTPLVDRIIYDLPRAEETINKYSNRLQNDPDRHRGVWIGTWFDSRVNYINKIFRTPKLLNMHFMGRGALDVNLYVNRDKEDQNIINTELPKIYSQCDYSIYFSRGKFTNMLGATFYEPLLNGLPLFVSTIADPNKEIFPGLDCYFSTEDELKHIAETNNLHELWIKQVKHLL